MAEKVQCDLAVLGGGPGGYTAAFRAADLGLSVCLVEERTELGGVCLHAGCIPSKTLIHAASLLESAHNAGEFGLTFPRPHIDLDALRAKKAQIVQRLAGGLDTLCGARKVTRLVGRGLFQDAGTLLVEGKGGMTQVAFRDVIIATGSRPVRLREAPDDPRIWGPEEALSVPFVPERMLIVGGGIIGMEMAGVYAALGARVTIVEQQDDLLPMVDRDLVEPLLRKWKGSYRILTGTAITAMTACDTAIQVDFDGRDEQESGSYDAVLMAVGRRPNTGGIGLEQPGLEIDTRGFLKVDERGRTGLSHFYAIGDVVGEPMLAHRATHQGKVAAEVIAGRKAAFTPMGMPSVVYTSPEIAWMGCTETRAAREGIGYRKGVFPWNANGRALCSGDATGLTKILFDRETGRIIGAGICGSRAGELIQEAVLALEMGADAVDIGCTVHAHPTLSETFALAAEMVAGSVTDALPPDAK